MSLDKLIRRKQRASADNNVAQLAVASKNLGDWYHENQQYDKALSCYSEEAAAYQSLGKKMENAKAHRMVGEMFMLLEKFDDALKHELIYLKTAVELKDKTEEQRAYATIGRVHLLKAQSGLNAQQNSEDLTKTIRNAEKAFLKSLLICKSLTDQSKHELLDMTARLYLNLGVTYECKGEFDEAIKHFEKAMSICRHNDFWDLLHQCYYTAGLLYFNKLDDNTKSLRLLNLAISTAERLSTNRTIRLCQTLISKAEVLINMADYQGAKQILHKAYKQKTTDESDAEAIESNLKIVAAMCYAEDELITIDSENYLQKKRLYEKLGDGACRLKNYSSAIGYYTKMLEAAEKNGDEGTKLIPVYVSLYQTYKDMKQYDTAIEFMWKEYELCKSVATEAYSTLFGIAETFEMAEKDFWETDNIYERAKSVAKEMGNKRKEKRVILKQIALREKHEMETLADIMRQALQSASFNAANDSDDDSGDENNIESSEEINTPDVGDDICLDDLSDSASENDEEMSKPTTAADQPRVLRKRGCIATKRNEKGETQLHRACITGNTSMVRRLIEQGHSVHVRDNAGWLPLHEAANHGFKEIVELLLDNGASINDKGGTNCDGFTPLHDACGNGVLPVIELLLDRGANATVKNDLGDTPLQTLEKWRAERTLLPHEQSYYETVYQRLHKQLEKAGVNPIHDSPPKRSCSAGTSYSSTASSHKFRSTTPRKRIISDSSSSEEGENKLPNSEGFQTIDNILNEEFPRVDSPENVSNDSPPIQSSPTDYRVDYREVMADLRHGSFKKKVDSIASNFRPVERIVKKSAMLAANEVSNDDWLDNDLAPSTKRRKYLNERTHSSDSNVSANRKMSSKFKQSGSGTLLNDSIVSSTNAIVINDNSDDENAFNVLMNSNQNTAMRRKKRLSSSGTSRLSGESNSFQQSSLLESGFHRYRTASPDPSPQSVTSTVVSPFKSIHTAPSANIIQSHSVKVQVSDAYLNIPVNMNNANDLTIEWLAEEAAKRYYSLKGVKPILRLTTKDGAIFENSDPLTLAFAENSAIASTVLEWVMPPLAQRYIEACAQTKTNVDPFIQSQIELIASTQSLTINDQMLIPKYSRSLFKSIHYQTNITRIDLTNSFIEDEGLKFLSQALPTMNQMVSLNLSGNLITSCGIKQLSCIFDTEPNSLPELNTLILNFNPLQNQSLSSLERFCQNLPHLRTLHLSSTDLTDMQDFDLKYSLLTDIDLSFNRFVSNGLTKSLEKLNACKLAKLNLSFCGSSFNRSESNGKSIIETLTKVLNAGNCANFEEIYLDGLNLSDIDCWQIIESIKRSKMLRTVSLTENVALTKVSWKFLLDNLSIQNLYLDGCKALLSDLSETDVDNLAMANNSGVSSCCENITISLASLDGPNSQFTLIKRLWASISQYAGKVFVHNRRVMLTLKPDALLDTEWEYHFS